MKLTKPSAAFAVGGEVLVLACCVAALADRRMHQQNPFFGVNQWGYRDEARGSKEPGEIRVAMVGGSAAYEEGLEYSSTLAGTMFLELRQAGARSGQSYSVVNLSEPQVGADSYVDTLRRYEYLEPDVVCVFDGYDALEGLPPHARQRSAVFRITGYLPTLPARLLRRPGWMSDPDGAVAKILRDDRTDPADVGCVGASASYCGAMVDTVRFALELGHAVMVVSPPSVSRRHAQQQQSLGSVLMQTFGGTASFKYLDLGSVMDLSDPVHSPDGLHRTRIGNHVVGQRIATTLLGSPDLLSGAVRARIPGSR
jgi:hypothetical protein